MNADVTKLQNATNLSAAGHTVPKKELGKDEFLKLLMTQLSAQDPLKPTDSAEFVSQLSQFSSLEGITNMGNKLDQLIKISGANNAAGAVGLLGKDVRVLGNTWSGKGMIHYELPQAAAKVQVSIRAKDGSVVKVIDNAEGKKGLNSLNVDDLKPGEYTFIVEAFDSQKQPLQSQLSHIERVTGVNFTDTVPILLMESGAKVRATEAMEVSVAGASNG